MRTIVKWFLRLLAGLATVLVLAVSVIYLSVEYRLQRSHDVAMTEIVVPGDAASIAEGERLGTLMGCNGCHRADLRGGLLFEEPGIARLVSPNLTQKLPEYTDAELERLIRHGLRPDGSTVLGMPSSGFYHLSDDHLGKLIAWLRTVEPVDNPLPETRIDIIGRFGLLMGEFEMEAEIIDHDAPRVEPGTGEYFARIACAECHGADFRGQPGFSPDLGQMVHAYSTESFNHLLRTGEPAVARDLDLMDDVAVSRFTSFSDAEVAKLYAFLKTLEPAVPELN